MSFSVGIIGLPNTGKSTLFKALTKKQVAIADYPFTTIEPNVGTVAVPDERLEKIAQIVKPEKVTKTVIEFIDIAGLVKGAHKGEGLGNQFLSYIRPCDGVIEVVRCFDKNNNPEEDIKIIDNELKMKDQELNDNVLNSKPKIYLFNVKADRDSVSASWQRPGLCINLKDEADMTDLSEVETKELGIKSQLDQLILACYNILDLITFYTIAGGKEARAWTLKKDSSILEAATKVHTDFAEKFIKAKVITWQEFLKSGSWKIVGKEYIVRDGDIIEFKI